MKVPVVRRWSRAVDCRVSTIPVPPAPNAMLDTFKIDTFKARLGELFHVIVDGQRLPTKLTEVYAWGDGSAAGRPRVPFALVFHTVPQAQLPQGTYRLENENLDAFEVFLVPQDPDERGMRYQAVFS